MHHGDMEEEISIKSVGAELVQVAEEWQRSPGETLTELFPYVFEASKRMSTRAISRWLEEIHGIKISQPTVSRALRSPKKYWQVFAESLEPYARIVENAVDSTMGSFMHDQRVFDWALEQPLRLCGDSPEELDLDSEEVAKAAHFIREHWFCLSPQTRSYMNYFFEDLDAKEQNTENKEEESK